MFLRNNGVCLGIYKESNPEEQHCHFHHHQNPGCPIYVFTLCTLNQYSVWLQTDDRGSISDRDKGFFLQCLCPDQFWGSPSLLSSGTEGGGGPFPGVKLGRGVTLTTHPHLVPRWRMSGSYSSSRPWRLHCGSGSAFTLYKQHVKLTTKK
jgi:hypothetical protein